MKKKRNRGTIIIAIAMIAVIAVAAALLVPILMDYRGTNLEYDALVEGYVEDIDADWEKVRIDFDALQKINPDIIGWIRFDDTDAVNVNYPILHADDDDTYLRHDFYGQPHTAGCIFLEAKNSPAFMDYYNIVYGHNMRNGSMFGTLKKYKEDGFYEENQYFTIYTPYAAYRYKIFAYRDVEDGDPLYSVGYYPGEGYLELIDDMVQNSMKDTGIIPSVTDRIVTLSTCNSIGSRGRFVIHAVCIDRKIY